MITIKIINWQCGGPSKETGSRQSLEHIRDNLTQINFGN